VWFIDIRVTLGPRSDRDCNDRCCFRALIVKGRAPLASPGLVSWVRLGPVYDQGDHWKTIAVREISEN